MRRIFIQQIIFLFLVCIPIKANKDSIDNIILYAGFAASYNWACTCKYYWNIINPDGSLLKKFSDIVKKIDIDTYTKEMICLARSENVDMFQWLKKNTNKENRKESRYIFRYMDRSDVDEKKRELTIYKTSEQVKESILKFIINSMGVLPLIRLLIHQGFNINHQWEDGDTLLHISAEIIKKNREDIIEILLAQLGIDVNIQNNKGETPLHKVIHHKQKKWKDNNIQQFLKYPGVLINLQDQEGNTALHTALIYGNYEQIKYLVQNHGIDFNIQNNDGNIALHFSNFYEYINLIPDFIAHINIKNKEGNTPLHVAKTFKHYTYLLQKCDINVNIKNNKGETPLHYSIKNPHVTSGGRGHLHVCITTISWDQAKILLMDERVDKAIVTNKGKTFLHYVAKYIYDSEILKYFFSKENINFQSVDCQGRTVLHMASKYHNNNAVQYLLKQMPSEIINLRDQKGYSALDYSLTTLKNKNKKNLKYRNEEKTVELFLKKVCVPLLLYGFFAMGLIGLSLYVLIHLW